MQTNITTGKLPSAMQPPKKTREELIKIIEAYQEKGFEDVAREIDTANKLGYFATKEKLLNHPSDYWLDQFITQDQKMLHLKEKIRILTSEKDEVLLIGESGTGKELLARALHGDKDKEKFVEINCAGLPEHLIESELFGHVKGSFTGATQDTEGLFQKAEGGTLFLDEMGELPLQLQAKLLRVLQFRTIRKVGGKESIPVNFRLVCATHQNLTEAISEGKFRLDLYYRISTIQLFTTPLRERPEDIPLIVQKLDENKGTFPTNFPWQSLALKHGLYGNVRNLQHIVRRYQLFKELPEV